MSFISDILGDAKSDILGGVTGAINQLGRGDLQGAFDSVAGIPGSVIDNAGTRGGTAFGDGFAGLNARQDAVQDWCWYCILPTIGRQTLPWYYVTSASVPHRKISLDTVKRNGHSANYAQSYELNGNLNLKFFMDSSSKAYDYFKAWQRLVLGDNDPTVVGNQGLWGLPKDYKKSITIVVTSVTKKDLLIFKYLDCFPTDPQSLEVGAGTSAPMEFSLDFAVEDVAITVKNDVGFLTNLEETAKGFGLQALKGAGSLFDAVPSGLDFFSSSSGFNSVIDGVNGSAGGNFGSVFT